MMRVTKAELIDQLTRVQLFHRMPFKVCTPLQQMRLREHPTFIPSECYAHRDIAKGEIGCDHRFRYKVPTRKGE